MRSDITPVPLAAAPLLTRRGSPMREFIILGSLLALVFSLPLYRLVGYVFQSGSLYSHVILIPFVSAYLVWIRRKSFSEPRRGSLFAAVPFVLGGGLFLLLYFALSRRAGADLPLNDFLSINVASFYSFFLAVAVFTLGTSFCRQILFPLAFFAFIIPFPDALTNALESSLKHSSAEIYAVLMNLLGQTYFRQGLVFALPNLSLEVAQECSGIRSSLVLFITSLIAGYMFLSKARNRTLLAFIVLPLGALRNAFRILVLSLLSTHWDPRIIDSPLHHRGGPLFFALSLIPFFLVLIFLVKSEKAAAQRDNGKTYV
jgi:exosortase C (VPDSG-CTERM-specific)